MVSIDFISATITPKNSKAIINEKLNHRGISRKSKDY